jgi:hypothetical protein
VVIGSETVKNNGLSSGATAGFKKLKAMKNLLTTVATTHTLAASVLSGSNNWYYAAAVTIQTRYGLFTTSKAQG